MSFDIRILPSGHLHCSLDNHARPTSTASSKIVEAFEQSTGKGLFALTTNQNSTTFSPSGRYWAEFSCAYMTERCHALGTQSGTESNTQSEIEPIKWNSDTQYMLLNAPPMIGAEYLSSLVMEKAWNEIDQWVCDQVIQSKTNLAEFLKKHAPRWRQVGRVCFHLAENKNDAEYPFAFLATYAPEFSNQGKIRYQPLGNALQAYAGENNKKALIHLLSPIQIASESSALIKELVDSGDIYHPLVWTPNEALQFMREAEQYESAGIIVRLPDWWKKRARPRVNVTLSSPAKNSFSVDDMLRFNVSIAFENNTFTQAEWQKLMDAEDGLVLLKGQWVEVDKEKLNQVLEHWKTVENEVQQNGLSFSEGMRLLAGTSADLREQSLVDEINEWSFIHAGDGLIKILDELRDPESLKTTRPGKALKGTLRPYQTTGVNWLWHLSQLGLGACLADDMGLGKTIQIIALFIQLKKKHLSKPSLLVLPASLLTNWKDELEKFAPSLNCQFVHSSLIGKDALKTLKQQLKQGDYDVILTSYGMLQRQDWLLEQEWQLVVLDEAQAIKNPGTRTTKSVKQLKAQSRIALTGTPIENRLGDLWSLFDFLCPGLLGSATKFKKLTKSMESSEQSYAPLRKLLQPYILRRLKTDKTIIDDLPEKTEVHAYCGLSKVQAVLYQKTVEELVTALDVGVDGIKRRGLVLAYILRFKQICNHPSQLKGDGLYRPQDSGKFIRLREICEEIASRQEKVLIFTQFREMTDSLAIFLAECFRQSGLILHGGTPVKQRKQLVNQFQSENGPPFFVLSIKAGGTGLNLTAASHVIHFDRWWNPAVENQATDRAFRIGQKRNVLVHKFVCKGTIEEKIDALMAEKQHLADDLLENQTQSTLTEMNNEELMELIKLDISQI